MKKILGSAAIVAWLVQVYLVVAALYGTDRLPERIPTHFGLDGKVNGWGTPQSLWLFPIIGTAMGLLLTVVSRYPGSFSYPVRVTRENQARIEELALRMIAWIRLEMLCLFAWIVWLSIETARSGTPALPSWGFPVAMLVIFGTIAVHIAGMVRSR